MIEDTDLEGVWTEAVVAYFEVLSWHSLGGIEKNNEKLQSD
jgi:hypothetical protein